MAAVESDLPPSIPHPIADASGSLHASNVVKSIQGPEFADSQPLVTDANDTSLPEVTKLAFDNSSSALLDASLGSMKPVDITENATHQNTRNASIAEETAMATVNPNDVEARDISESTTTLDKSATEDSPMENDAKGEDAHSSLTEQAPTGLSSNLSTATTETTTEAVETMVLRASEDQQLTGSVEIKGDPIPPNNVVGEPVVGQEVTETVSSKPDEELEKEEIAIVAETNSTEKDDTAENHLVVEDAETKVDDREAPEAVIASVMESKTLEGKITMPIETIPVERIHSEAEAKDHSAAEDVFGSDKKESNIEADQADVSGAEVEDRVAESAVGGVHEEVMKVEHEEADERKDKSVEAVIGGQVKEVELTVETTAASPLANETPIETVPAIIENPDLSNVETSVVPEETLSASIVSIKEKTSEETIVPHPNAGIFDPLQAAVGEPAPLLQKEALETIAATAKEASIEEEEVANPNIEEQATDSTTAPHVAESQSHPVADVEADFLVEETAIPERGENVLEVTVIGTEPFVGEVGEITPESIQHEVAAQESSTEMVNKPVVDDAIQQAPEEQRSVEEIAAPPEAEVTKQSVVEAVADPVSEAHVVQESPSLKAPVPSKATAESVADKVEEAPVAEVQKTDAEHEVIAEEVSSKELIEEAPVADRQPPVDLAPIQDGKEQPSEKVEEIVEEQASAVVEVSQDGKDGVAVEAPTTEVEKVLAEETSVKTDKVAVEEIPAEAEKAAVEEIPAEAETALVDSTPAKVDRTVEEKIPVDTEKPVVEEEKPVVEEEKPVVEEEKPVVEEEKPVVEEEKPVVEEEKPVVEEVPAEAETALVNETYASIKAAARVSELPKPAVEEEHSAEASTTIEGEQPQMNEAVVDVEDEVIEKVTEAVSEETIVDSVPADKDTAEVLHNPDDVPASEKDAVETPAGPVNEKEEVAVKQDVEQIGEPEQVQHIPSVREREDAMYEIAEVPASVETVPLVKAELVVEEAGETPTLENLAVNTLATVTPERDTGDVPVVEGKQDLEEQKAVTVDESASRDQQSEAVISHEIGDTGAVTSEDVRQDVVPCMDDSLVSEVSEADTTTETIIVPEPVTQKKSDSAGPTVEEINASHADEAPILVHDDIEKDKLQLHIPREATPVERPKSPWTPSFQVTTIGQGTSLPPEDILVHSLDGSEETTAIPSEEASVAVNDSSSDAPVNVSRDESEEDELKSASSLWTPSYSVHSQGSPNPPYASLELETPATGDKEVEVETAVLTVEQALVHEDAVPSVTEEPEPEHVESQPTEAEQAEKVAVETTSVTEEPIAVIENATPESPTIKEPLNEVFVTEGSIPVPTIQGQDTSAIPTSRVEEESPEEDQPALETAPAELQVSEQHNAEDNSSLTPPEQQSRSASPSWVPSYSVSRQGSPVPRPVPLPSADISEIKLAPPQTDVLVQEDIHNDALKDAASSVTAPTVVVDGAEVVEVEKAQPVEDHPATPWTPSYSVTVQGADVLEETAIESLSPTTQPEKAKDPEVRQRRSLSEEMESGAFSPTALIGAGFAGGAAVYAASAALRNSNDGRTSIDVAETQTQQEKLFPTVEIPDGNKHHNAPRFDGNEASHATVARSPETSPISSRKRLESTTSSRLFPGGWFSTSSKIPDERTSLEVAQGVFTGAKQGGPVEGSLQSPTSPTAEPITPVREQSSSDKRKWCTIM